MLHCSRPPSVVEDGARSTSALRVRNLAARQPLVYLHASVTEPAQVIPYASTANPRRGLSLGTILAIFAICQAFQAFVSNVRRIEYLKVVMNSRTASPATVALYWLDLATVFSLLIGAVLLLLLRKRTIGGIIVAGVSVFDALVAIPLYLAIVWTSPLIKSIPRSQVVMWAQVSLGLAAAAPAAWLLCRLASQCRRAVVADGTSWSAVRTTCAWSMVLFGLCRTAVVLVSIGQATSMRPSAISSMAAQPLTIAAMLLTLGGIAAVMHQPWSRRLCIIAAIAWALQPVATSLYDVWRIPSFSIAGQFLGVAGIEAHIRQLPFAILWILLLTHPQIYACWGSRSEGHSAQSGQDRRAGAT